MEPTPEQKTETPGLETPSVANTDIRTSPNLDALATALAKATLEFERVDKDANNPYFNSKYADLAAIISATRPALAKHGLVFLQFPIVIGNKAKVISRLLHASGQWIESDLELTAAKGDAQGLGSIITYARRYAGGAFLNIAGESDDDGNAAVGTSQKDRKSTSTDVSEKDGRTINPTQVRAFWSAVKQGGKTNDEVAAYLKSEHQVSETDKILKVMFDNAMKWAVSSKTPPEGSDLTPALMQSVDTTKALKRLWAVAGEVGMTEESVKAHAYPTYKVSSLKQLTLPQFSELIAWMQQ